MTEDLPFTVEEWNADASHIQRILARCGNLIVARAAYDAAARLYPDKPLMLSHRARIVASQNMPK